MKKMLRRGHVLFLGVIGLLLLLLLVVYWRLRQTIPVQISQIDTAVVRVGPLDLGIKGLCKLAPRRPVALTANSGGTVVSIAADAGTDLRDGDLVVKLENPELVEAFRSAASILAEKRIELTRLLTDARSEIVEKRTTLRNNLDKEQVQEVRVRGLKKLADEKIISAVDYEEQQLQLRSLRRQNEANKAQVSSIAVSARSIEESNKLLLENLKSNVENLTIQIQRLEVTSPLDGVVLDLGTNVAIGARLSPGDVVARVSKRDDLVAICQLPSEFSISIEKGTKAIVLVQGVKRQGVVYQINPQSVRGETEVRVSFDAGRSGELRAGQVAALTVIEKTIASSVYVRRPAGGVPSPQKEYLVYVINTDEQTASQRRVIVGVSDNENMQIISNLQLGETIIVSDTEQFNGKTISLD